MKNLVTTTLTALALLFSGTSCTEAEAGSPDTVKSTIEKHLSSIETAAEDIEDEATAKNANTTITGLVNQISTALGGAKLIPGDGLKDITETVKSKAGSILETLKGLSPELQKHVTDAIAKLTNLTK